MRALELLYVGHGEDEDLAAVAERGVVVHRVGSVFECIARLKRTAAEEYKAFLRYKVIREHRSYCTKALDDEFFAFYSRDLSGQKEQKPEDKRSIGVVNAFAGEMMGKVYVATMFPP